MHHLHSIVANITQVPVLPNRASIGLLIFRVVTGSAMMLHGWPKIQEPFSWMSASSTVPPALQFLAAIAEFGGGLALVLGLLTPLACIGIIATMAVAIFMVHVPQGHAWVAKGKSYESAASYLVASVLLLLTGPGKFALDAKLSRISARWVRTKSSSALNAYPST